MGSIDGKHRGRLSLRHHQQRLWGAFAAAGVNMRLSYIPRWYWQRIGSPDLPNVVVLVCDADAFRGTHAALNLVLGTVGSAPAPIGAGAKM